MEVPTTGFEITKEQYQSLIVGGTIKRLICITKVNIGDRFKLTWPERPMFPLFDHSVVGEVVNLEASSFKPDDPCMFDATFNRVG